MFIFLSLGSTCTYFYLSHISTSYRYSFLLMFSGEDVKIELVLENSLSRLSSVLLEESAISEELVPPII